MLIMNEAPLLTTPWKKPEDELPIEGQKVLAKTGDETTFVYWSGEYWYWYEYHSESKRGPEYWCPIP